MAIGKRKVRGGLEIGDLIILAPNEGHGRRMLTIQRDHDRLAWTSSTRSESLDDKKIVPDSTTQAEFETWARVMAETNNLKVYAEDPKTIGLNPKAWIMRCVEWDD